jgi:ribosomal protein L14
MLLLKKPNKRTLEKIIRLKSTRAIIESLVLEKSILAVLDKYKTGALFLKLVKKLNEDTILGRIIVLDRNLQYPATRTLGQLVVARLVSERLRTLEFIIDQLEYSNRPYLEMDVFVVLQKAPTEEEQTRYVNHTKGFYPKSLVEGETLLTVIDNSGALYARYIKSLDTNLEETNTTTLPKEAVVEIVKTVNVEVLHEFDFSDVKVNDIYHAKIESRTKTFTRRDGSGDFTKTEYCARLIRPV